MATAPPRGCRFLLGGLILLMMLFPWLEDMARPILLTALVAAVFGTGVIIVHPGRLRVRNTVALAIVQIGLTGLALTLPAGSFVYIGTIAAVLMTTAVLIGYCIYCVLRYVLQAKSITRDQIYAGICVYLMFG